MLKVHDEPTRYRKIDWSAVFGGMASALGAILKGLLKLLLVPFKVYDWLVTPSASQAARAQQAAAQGSDRMDGIERALEQRMAAQPKAATRRLTPSKALTALLHEIAEGKPMDVLSLCSLDVVAVDWVRNLTPAQAQVALTHSAAAVILHLRGETTIEGLPPRMTQARRMEMIQEARGVSRRYKFPTYGRRARETTYDDISDERLPAMGY